jgi:membrane protein insertase Oxa1/YidC/SpoIIIJ
MVSNLMIIAVGVLLIVGVIVYFYFESLNADKKYEEEHGKPPIKNSDTPLIFQLFFAAYPLAIIVFIVVGTIIAIVVNNMFNKSTNINSFKSNSMNIRNRNNRYSRY